MNHIADFQDNYDTNGDEKIVWNVAARMAQGEDKQQIMQSLNYDRLQIEDTYSSVTNLLRIGVNMALFLDTNLSIRDVRELETGLGRLCSRVQSENQVEGTG